MSRESRRRRLSLVAVGEGQENNPNGTDPSLPRVIHPGRAGRALGVVPFHGEPTDLEAYSIHGDSAVGKAAGLGKLGQNPRETKTWEKQAQGRKITVCNKNPTTKLRRLLSDVRMLETPLPSWPLYNLTERGTRTPVAGKAPQQWESYAGVRTPRPRATPAPPRGRCSPR